MSWPTVREWSLFAVIVIGAGLLRFHDLDRGGIWLDEGCSLLQIERTFQQILALNAHDPHPPLYLFALKAWLAPWGSSTTAAKVLSAGISLVGIVAVMFSVRERFGFGGAVYAGLFLTLSAAHFQYSREVRGYILALSCVALADWMFVRWQKYGRPLDLAAWAVLLTIGLYTHYFVFYCLACFAVAGFASWWWPTAGVQRPGLQLILSFGVVSLAALPALELAREYHQLSGQGLAIWIVPATGSRLLQCWVFVAGGPLPLAVVAALTFIGLGGVPRKRAWLNPTAAPVPWKLLIAPLLIAMLPFVLFVLSHLLRPMLVERYLLFSLVALATLVASAGAALARPIPFAVGALLIVVSLVPQLIATIDEEHRQQAELKCLEQTVDWQPGDIVLYSSRFQMVPAWIRHAQSPRPEFLAFPAEPWNVTGADRVDHVLAYWQDRPYKAPAPEQLQKFERIWFVADEPAHFDRLKREPWAQQLDWQDRGNCQKIGVYLYDRRSAASANASDVPVTP